MKLNTYVLLATLFQGALAQDYIQPPAFTKGSMLLGLSDDQSNLLCREEPIKLGYDNFFHYRNLDSRELVKSTELLNQMSLFLQHEKTYPLSKPGAMNTSLFLSFFGGETKIEPLLQKLNNPNYMLKYFNFIKLISDSINKIKNPNDDVVVFIEPDAWATLLQAKFHFGKKISPSSNLLYQNVLDFPASISLEKINSSSVKGSDLLSQPLDQVYFSELNNYENKVSDLPRAIIHLLRKNIPNVKIGMTFNTWAAYSKGCADGNAIEEINSKIINDTNRTLIQGGEGIQTWGVEDIKISAYANAHFYKKIFDSSFTGNSITDRPDFYGIGRNGLDAGLVMAYPSLDASIYERNIDPNPIPTNGKLSSEIPGAGTNVYYWSGKDWNKWLQFSKIFAHSMKTPLIAIQMPVGKLGMPNKLFQFEDTFADWLFNEPTTDQLICREGLPCSWANGDSQSNWDKFKNSGFVGIWAGREGWPSWGTSYGPVTRDDFTSEQLSLTKYPSMTPFLPVEKSYDPSWNVNLISLGNPIVYQNDLSKYLLDKIKKSDRSLHPLAVDPEIQNDLFEYSGVCAAGSIPVISKVNFTGCMNNDSKCEKSLIFEMNHLNAQNLPEIIKNKGMVTLAVKDTLTEELVLLGENRYGDEIVNYFNDPNNSKMAVNISIQYANFIDKTTKKIKPEALLPLSYKWYVFDLSGQYVNSEVGRIESDDLAKYLLVDTVKGIGTLKLESRFALTDSKGRKIATGPYLWKGVVEEQTKVVSTTLSTGEVVSKSVSSENQVIRSTFGVIRK